MKFLLAHWVCGKSEFFRPVASAIEQMGHKCDWVPRNNMERRSELIDAILSKKYGCMITWQRFYSMQSDILGAIKDSGIQTVFMDYGFYPHYRSAVFDPDGENASSRIAASWSQPECEGTPWSKRGVVPPVFPGGLARPMRFHELEGRVEYPYVFVPLQRPMDSVVRYDSRVHDFSALVRHVLYLCSGRFFVIIKPHPLDVGINLGIDDYLCGSHLVVRAAFGSRNEPLNERLIRESCLTLGINSNMLFRAMLMDKPVTALGLGWHTGSGAYHEIDGLENLDRIEIPLINYAARRRFWDRCMSSQAEVSQLHRPDVIIRMLNLCGVQLRSD